MSFALYTQIFLYSIIILTFFSSASFSGKDYYQIEERSNTSFLFALVICIVFSIWIGMRPPTYEFGDTGNYAFKYNLMKDGVFDMSLQYNDMLWMKFMYWCSQIMSDRSFFTIVSIGYFGFSLWASSRFCPNNPLICMLFIMDAFSFYAYGINGIRNGLACAITLVSFSYLIGNKKDLIVGLLMAILAINIHNSTILPIGMAIISKFFVKDFKWALRFWILSIFISLIAGELINNFFAGLGFDDRLSYLTAEQEEDKFSHTGFRWDFLLYSFMPILLGYYIVIKRNIQNHTFNFLLNTYTLANAFWVMVIRANYSNRFAYLSWFMYPLVLAYPLLKVDVWGELQGKRLQQIMLAQVGFTWFMQTIYG